MTNDTSPNPTNTQETRSHSTGEKTACWIVFGATTLSMLMMLGLWNWSAVSGEVWRSLPSPDRPLLERTSIMSEPQVASTVESTAQNPRRWLALSFLALAQFLVVLDASIVNIALPVIGSDLHMNAATLAWVITAYVLPFGGLLLFGGRLADRFGHRRLFLTGTVGFVIASTLAGLSVSSGMLILAR